MARRRVAPCLHGHPCPVNAVAGSGEQARCTASPAGIMTVAPRRPGWREAGGVRVTLPGNVPLAGQLLPGGHGPLPLALLALLAVTRPQRAPPPWRVLLGYSHSAM
jgi:hypothetical protein